MQYQLDISIDSAGLNTIYGSGQAVTLVKDVIASPSASANLPIAWVEFQPFQTNLVTWIENYYVYATITTVQAGATIVMTSISSTPVQDGWTYTFAQGQFSAASGGAAGVFTVNNNTQGQTLSFGLAQQATINGATVLAPLNAVKVPYNESVTFTPIENISIFTSAYINNGAVISQVSSNALAVQLTSQSPTANIGYNDSSNSFYLESAATISSFEHASRLIAK